MCDCNSMLNALIASPRKSKSLQNTESLWNPLPPYGGPTSRIALSLVAEGLESRGCGMISPFEVEVKRSEMISRSAFVCRLVSSIWTYPEIYGDD